MDSALPEKQVKPLPLRSKKWDKKYVLGPEDVVRVVFLSEAGDYFHFNLLRKGGGQN